MRVFDGLMGLLFLLFAFFQFNDPDPVVWGTYYALAGVAAASCVWMKRPGGLVWMTLGASGILVLSSFPGLIEFWNNQDGNTLAEGMSKEFSYIEETREFGGAILVIVWTGLALLRPTNRPHIETPTSQSLKGTKTA